MHKAHLSFKFTILAFNHWALSAWALWIANQNIHNFPVIQAGSSTVHLRSLEGSNNI